MSNPTGDDIHDLDREADPRGGEQADEYRTADPRDLVITDGVAMSGPAGSPQARDAELREGEHRDRD